MGGKKRGRQHKQNQSTRTGGVDRSGPETSRGKNKRECPVTTRKNSPLKAGRGSLSENQTVKAPTVESDVVETYSELTRSPLGPLVGIGNLW